MKKLMLAALTSSLTLGAMADAPEILRYQGRLVDGNTLVNDTLPMSFKLFNSTSGGSLLYEDSSSVLVVDGLYATYIGDDTVTGSLTDALTNAAVFLEVTIDGETLSPREQLTSVPYALNTKADPTPSGTIVLSPSSPNIELEAQGYSLYYEDVVTADWEPVYDAPYVSSPGGQVFSYGNKIGIYSESPEYDVYLSEMGKRWETAKCPVNFNGFTPDILEFNGALFFFATEYENAACFTSDFENWNVWTNQFSTNMYDTFYIDEVVVFKDALWSFVRDMNSSNLVMRSTDGMNWTQMSTGDWSDLYMYGDVIISSDKLFVNSVDMPAYSNYVWSSADGISWSKSTSTTPSEMGTPELVFHDNELWSIFQDSYSMDGKLWKSNNDGNSWSMVTTNLPQYTIMNRYRVMSEDNNLWLWGNDSSHTEGAVLWSEDGIDGELSLKTSYMSESAEIISLENGRLWLFTGADSTTGGAPFYFIGGPKKEDGLYYYQKD